MNLSQRKQKRCQALPASHDAEFGGLLDGVCRVETGIRQTDHLGARGLSLKQEGREVGGGERMAYGTQNLTALGLGKVAGLLFQRIAERIVCGQEEPGVAALLHQRAAGADRESMRVIGPVETVGRALCAG